MSEKKLWYKEEAKAWVEALPLGNGRIGAMVYSGVHEDRVSLNEDTFWSGYNRDKNPKGAQDAFKRAQDMMLEGDFKQAQSLMEDLLEGGFTESYLPFCDLLMSHRRLSGKISHYKRSLDLSAGISEASFVSDGVTYTREAFVSHPDQAFVMKLSADQPGKISLGLSLTSLVNNTITAKEDTLSIALQAPGMLLPNYVKDENPIAYPEEDAQKGMRALGTLQARPKGGSVKVSGETLEVTGADSVLLIFCLRTSFNGFDRQPYVEGRDEKALVQADLKALKNKSWQQMKDAHLNDFRPLFDRVDFHLDIKREEDLDTGERLKRFLKNPDDPSLYELIFHYGRYLIISASRPGSQAMNLQGIWNNQLRAPWSSNYTLNINTQMNYWPALPCNLAEMAEPLYDLIQKLRITGRVTARETYGAGGVVAHHNSDLWGLTNAVGNRKKDTARYALWPFAFAWLCRHLMEHYDYTGDLVFLREKALPAISDAAEFLCDTLRDNSLGSLSFFPATSPENTFFYQGEEIATARCSAMSNAITKEVFFNLLRCGEALQINSPLMDRVRELLPRIAPYQLGEKGQLLEWDQEYQEAEPNHRHVSHLYPLYPGREIDPETTPHLAQAVKRSLELRGDEGTGWSLGWKISLWARLRDGERALELLNRQLRLVPSVFDIRSRGGGSYLNLFGAHPPFQIDGNFAAAAGIAEMLLQNAGGEILLLPALPKAWEKGFVKGLRAFSGAEVSLWFEDGELKEARVLSTAQDETALTLRYQDKRVQLKMKQGEDITLRMEDFI
ncbi:MAG: glycoside hydrolase family 95 protein [Bacillota bacterium]|nr:glycoside hydrolase family 95 protein [Bacillota bacterium]